MMAMMMVVFFFFDFHSKATDMFEKFRLWIDDPTLCGRPAAPPGTKVMSQLGVVMCLAGTFLLTSILLLYETFFLEPLLCPHFLKKKKKEKGEMNPARHTARKRRLLDNTAIPDFVR